MTLLQAIGLLSLWVGVVFAGFGTFGTIRFPDMYTRLHATTKVAVLGLVSLLMGTCLFMPEATPRAVLLAGFMVITSPVASHAVAIAGYRQGVPMAGAVRDDLAELERTIREESQGK